MTIATTRSKQSSATPEKVNLRAMLTQLGRLTIEDENISDETISRETGISTARLSALRNETLPTQKEVKALQDFRSRVEANLKGRFVAVMKSLQQKFDADPKNRDLHPTKKRSKFCTWLHQRYSGITKQTIINWVQWLEEETKFPDPRNIKQLEELEQNISNPSKTLGRMVKDFSKRLGIFFQDHPDYPKEKKHKEFLQLFNNYFSLPEASDASRAISFNNAIRIGTVIMIQRKDQEYGFSPQDWKKLALYSQQKISWEEVEGIIKENRVFFDSVLEEIKSRGFPLEVSQNWTPSHVNLGVGIAVQYLVQQTREKPDLLTRYNFAPEQLAKLHDFADFKLQNWQEIQTLFAELEQNELFWRDTVTFCQKNGYPKAA